MLWSVALASAAGALWVGGPEGCLDEEAIDLELRAVLGDDTTAALDLAVTYQVDPGGDRLALVARNRGGAVIWERALPVAREDCALLPPVIARSVETGLAALPGWQREARPPEAALYATVTAPAGAWIGAGTGLRVALGTAIRARLDVEGFASTGAPTGELRWQAAGAGVALGPAVRARLGRGLDAELGARIWGGAAVYTIPIPFNREASPRLAGIADAALHLGPLLRIGLRAEVPVNRVRLATPPRGEPVTEPALRVGAALGVGGPVRPARSAAGTGDGAAPARP